jgi:membrane fusion protein, multidrug efflux system
MKWLRTASLLLSLAVASFAAAAEPAPLRAQLTARNAAVVSAEISGKVRQLHVLEGASFKKGDALVSIDDSLQRAQLQRAQAVLVGAERAFAANQRLHTLNSVGQIELDLSQTEVAKARAELAYASAMLEKCEIRAPFDGRMAEQRIRSLEFVQAGQALFEIVDSAPPQIDFIAPSKWLSWLKAGLPLEIRIDETGKSYPAVIERIGSKVDAVSQSIRVVAGVTDMHPDLMPGMSGTIVLPPPGTL